VDICLELWNGILSLTKIKMRRVENSLGAIVEKPLPLAHVGNQRAPRVERFACNAILQGLKSLSRQSAKNPIFELL